MTIQRVENLQAALDLARGLAEKADEEAARVRVLAEEAEVYAKLVRAKCDEVTLDLARARAALRGAPRLPAALRQKAAP